jgi:hypothetical protein
VVVSSVAPPEASSPRIRSVASALLVMVGVLSVCGAFPLTDQTLHDVWD